jgi:hypothetical protein
MNVPVTIPDTDRKVGRIPTIGVLNCGEIGGKMPHSCGVPWHTNPSILGRALH